MNVLNSSADFLWIIFIGIALSTPLFLLLLWLRQIRWVRRLRRRLLQRDWQPVFLERYQMPAAADHTPDSQKH